MDIGVVLQTTPPSARVVDLAKRAETYGFSHVWTFDSHILWQEPFPIYTRDPGARPRNVIVGPMVTNPATRDWTVTASLFATLNEMFGNRTVIGIGRGDSAVRVINGKPATLADAPRGGPRDPRARERPEVEYQGSTLRFPWASKSRVEVWVAGYGPKALAADRARWVTASSCSSPIRTSRRGRSARCATAAEEAGRDPDDVTICVAAPAYVSDDLAHARDQCRWFGGMVGNHVADIVARYGETLGRPDGAHRVHQRAARATTTTSTARRGTSIPQFVPDEIVDRFCVLGPVEEHVRRLEELKGLGVDQFAVYLQHDAKDETLQVYGEKVIPAIADIVRAKT